MSSKMNKEDETGTLRVHTTIPHIRYSDVSLYKNNQREMRRGLYPRQEDI